MKRGIALALAALLAACSRGSSNAKGEHEGHVAQVAPDPHAEHTGHGDAGAMPKGYTPITLDPARAEAMQLATAGVVERDFVRKLRTVGVVTLDETRTAHVHPKVRGWIDGLYVDFVGRKVRGGEGLCSIYSQEVFAAEIEFLAILDRAAVRPSVPSEFAETEARVQQQLTDAARRRLSLWDVPKVEIDRLARTREPRKTFPLIAPRAGVVVAKQAVDGMYVDPSLELYTITDLSRVWVLADVYENDISQVHVGDHAKLSIEGEPEPIDAKIAFLPPTLDESTRTLKARFELDNKGGRFRPGSFVSVAMDLSLGRGLGVPESAVLRTGTRAIVFLVHGAHVEPREVHLGPLVGDAYRVESGLAEGDKVAVGAQFLLDSESRLRATSAPGGGHVH